MQLTKVSHLINKICCHRLLTTFIDKCETSVTYKNLLYDSLSGKYTMQQKTVLFLKCYSYLSGLIQ